MSDNRPSNSARNCPPTPGQQAKRAACDRCRTQKLRCIYNGGASDSCERCRRAGVKCNHSPSLRMGRPPHSERQRTGEPNRGSFSEPAERPDHGMDQASSGASDQNLRSTSASDQSLPNPGLGLSCSLQCDEQSDSSAWQDLELEAFQTTASATSASMTSRNSSLSLYNSAMEERNPTAFSTRVSESNYLNVETDFMLDDFDFSNERGVLIEDPIALDLSPRPPQHTPSLLASSHMDGVAGTEGAVGLSDCQNTLVEKSQDNRLLSHASGQMVMTTPRSTSASRETSSQGPPDVQDNQMSKSLIEKLSNLNIDLLGLMKLSGAADWTAVVSNSLQWSGEGTIAPPPVPPDAGSHLIHDILEASQRFLDLLRLFLPQPPELCSTCQGGVATSGPPVSHCSTISPPRTVHEHQARSVSYPYVSGITAHSGALMFSQPSVHHAPADQGSPWSTTSTTVRPDTQTVFIIIACHVHLLRIYDNLFSHILGLLAARPAPIQVNSVTPFPGLQLDRFPIQTDGNLQLLILVHVIVHMLDSTERTLGCHRRFTSDSDSRDVAVADWHRGKPHESYAVRNCSRSGGESPPCSHREDRCEAGVSVLGRCRSLKLLEMAIQHEDMESQENGKRRISSLREVIKGVKRLLEGD